MPVEKKDCTRTYPKYSVVSPLTASVIVVIVSGAMVSTSTMISSPSTSTTSSAHATSVDVCGSKCFRVNLAYLCK